MKTRDHKQAAEHKVKPRVRGSTIRKGARHPTFISRSLTKFWRPWSKRAVRGAGFGIRNQACQ